MGKVAPAEESAFAARVESHRRGLHMHCYRMLGSYEEAEDVVQETLLRAWRGGAGFEGRSGYRTWLYKIATNLCCDVLKRTARRVRVWSTDLTYPQPHPDAPKYEVAARDAEPDAVVVAKETVELAFLAAIQLLPPRQRAVLMLRDALGWPATETALLLETSVAAANSALQRARATVRERLSASRDEWSVAEPSDEERAALWHYLEAHQRSDVDALAALARQDLEVVAQAA